MKYSLEGDRRFVMISITAQFMHVLPEFAPQPASLLHSNLHNLHHQHVVNELSDVRLQQQKCNGIER